MPKTPSKNSIAGQKITIKTKLKNVVTPAVYQSPEIVEQIQNDSMSMKPSDKFREIKEARLKQLRASQKGVMITDPTIERRTIHLGSSQKKSTKIDPNRSFNKSVSSKRSSNRVNQVLQQSSAASEERKYQ